MSYIGIDPTQDLSNLPAGTVKESDLSSGVANGLLGTNNVTVSNLSTEVTEKLLPEPEAGDANKVVAVVGSEDGYESIAATGAAFVTPANISGAASGNPDESNQGYTGSGSDSVDPSAGVTMTYYWTLSAGNLSAATGTNVNVNFGIAQKGTNQTLSVYAMDDQGNRSETTNLTIAVADTSAPSGLSLSLPAVFKHTIADIVDVTVGDDGFDSNLSYSWERNLDSGGWVNTGFSNANIKAPTLTLPSGSSVLVRVTVSNGAGSLTETGSAISVVASLPDNDSQFVDTTVKSMASTEMVGTAIGANLLEVPTGWEMTNENVISGTSPVMRSMTAIDSNRVIVTYTDTNAYVAIGTISGNTIEFGTPTLLTTVTFATPNLKMAGTDRFVVVFGSTPDLGSSIVGTISGTDITVGSVVNFSTTSINYHNIVFLSGDKVAVIYQRTDANGYGWYRIGTISGTSISYGTDTTWNAYTTKYITAYALEGDKLAVAFNDGSNSQAGTVKIVTYSGGSTLSFGTSYVFQSGQCNYITLGVLNSTTIVATAPSSSYVGIITGTTVAFGSAAVINPGSYINSSWIAILDESNIVITHYDVGNGNARTARFGSISGDTITFGDEVVMDVSNYINIPMGLNSTSFVASYGNTSYIFVNNIAPFAQNDLIQLPSGAIDTVASVDVSQGLEPYTVEQDISSTSVKITRPSDGTFFNDGDSVIINGDTDVLTTVSGTPSQDQAAGDDEAVITDGPSFGSGNLITPRMCKVDTADTIVVVYRDTGDSSKGRSYAGTISGTTITWGPNSYHNSNTTNFNTEQTVKAIPGTNKVLVAYCNTSGSTGMRLKVGTVTGNTISWGGDNFVESEAKYYPELIAVSSTKVICTWRSGTAPYNTRGCVATISGTSVGHGSIVNIHSSTQSDGSRGVAINSTQAAFVLSQYSQGIYGRILTVSGTSLQVGTSTQVYYQTQVGLMGLGIAFNGTDVVVIGHDLKYYIGTISGTTISFSVGTAIDTGDYAYKTWPTITYTDTNQYILTFNGYYGAVHKGLVIVGTRVGDVINWQPVQEFEDGTAVTMEGESAVISTGKVAIAYKHQDKSGQSAVFTTTPSAAYNTTLTFADNRPANPTAVNTILADGDSAQAIYLTNNDAASGTVKNISASYSVPQIAQDNGQSDFLEMDLEVQYTRNKFSVTDSSGDALINHGGTAAYPFINGDKVLVSGDTDVFTTVNAVPTRGSVAGTEDVVIGTDYVINDDVQIGQIVTVLSPTTCVITYVRGGGSSFDIVSTVGTISGTTISWGTPVLFKNNPGTLAEYISIDSLTSTTFVLTWSMTSGDNNGYAVIGTVSGTTISFGADYEFESDIAYHKSVTAVSSTNFFIAYRNASGNGVISTGTVSGTTISFGTKQTYQSGTMYDPEIVKLDDTKAFVAWRYGTSSAKGMVVTLSGTTCTLGTAATIVSGDNRSPRVAVLSSDRVMILYYDSGEAGKYSVCNISGTTITPLTSTQFIPSSGTHAGIVSISENKVIITHNQGGSEKVLFADINSEGIVTLSSNTISTGAGVAYRPHLRQVDDNKIIFIRDPNSGSAASVNIMYYDGSQYTSTISTTDALPTNVATIESLPLELESDLHSSTATLVAESETYTAVNATTMKATASHSGDSGSLADIKLKVNNTDGSDLSVTRIQADFQN
jgi:hypothetical protein